MPRQTGGSKRAPGPVHFLLNNRNAVSCSVSCGPHLLQNLYHAKKTYTIVLKTLPGKFRELGLRLNRQFDIEPERKLTFTDNKFAFQSKTTSELLRASLCFNLFSIKYVFFSQKIYFKLFYSLLKTTRRSWAPWRKFSAKRHFMRWWRRPSTGNLLPEKIKIR